MKHNPCPRCRRGPTGAALAGSPVNRPSSGPPEPGTQAAPGSPPAVLRCEYRSNPLGSDSPRPRLNWALASEGRAKIQRAFRVLVASSARVLDMDRGDLWDSGKVCTAHWLGIAYVGSALRSGQRRFGKVCIGDARGRPSVWSPMAACGNGSPVAKLVARRADQR